MLVGCLARLRPSSLLSWCSRSSTPSSPSPVLLHCSSSPIISHARRTGSIQLEGRYTAVIWASHLAAPSAYFQPAGADPRSSSIFPLRGYVFMRVLCMFSCIVHRASCIVHRASCIVRERVRVRVRRHGHTCVYLCVCTCVLWGGWGGGSMRCARADMRMRSKGHAQSAVLACPPCPYLTPLLRRCAREHDRTRDTFRANVARWRALHGV